MSHPDQPSTRPMGHLAEAAAKALNEIARARRQGFMAVVAYGLKNGLPEDEILSALADVEVYSARIEQGFLAGANVTVVARPEPPAVEPGKRGQVPHLHVVATREEEPDA